MAEPQPSDGFEWMQAPWGTILRCRPLLDVAGHFFSIGNLELRDDRAEWEAVAEQMGVDLEQVLLIRQVHGATVAVARRGRQNAWIRPEADVIVSDDRSAAIGVRVADCAPVLIADRRRGVVGAAHAGWRGAVQRAAMVAVKAMHDSFGSVPEDLVAAIGPCLGPCCGEVGPEVAEAFRNAGHSSASLGRWLAAGRDDRLQLDLPRVNRDQLEEAGIPPSQIHVSGLCTRSFPEVFHSYRVMKERAGRMIGVIRASAVIADC
jgi:purine-nucleoside/S-methyl-5'-thioadenosine phosphorylase / adenosine deaminase